jgi:hypothetical protein
LPTGIIIIIIIRIIIITPLLAGESDFTEGNQKRTSP